MSGALLVPRCPSQSHILTSEPGDAASARWHLTPALASGHEEVAPIAEERLVQLGD
jgi:hypothetical protein